MKNLIPRVLFIEDDEQQMEIFRIYLERNMIEIERCYEGLDGLAVAKHWKPDFILLDVRMEGLDGLAVLKELVKDSATENIPTIAYTNYNPGPISKDFFDLGAIAVWEKTIIRPPELVKRIKKLHQVKHNLIESNHSSSKIKLLLKQSILSN